MVKREPRSDTEVTYTTTTPALVFGAMATINPVYIAVNSLACN